MESFDHLWKEIVHVFAITALIWVGQEPPDLLQLSPATPTQPFDLVIPTVTVYSPSRCLPIEAYPSTLGNSSSLDAELLHRILVFLFGLSTFGFFSLAVGAFCLSYRATRSSSPPLTSLSSNVSPSLALSVGEPDDVTVRGAQAGLQVEHCEMTEELSVKIENLANQITAQASVIQFLKLNHECDLATAWSAFERQKTQTAASYRALEVQSQSTIAYLNARIAQLEQQAVNQATIAHQLKTTHKQELEATEAKNQSAVQTLTAAHESKTNSITKDLVDMQALTTRQLHTALNENTALKSSNARLAKLESSQSATITDLTVQLESTSSQLEGASAERNSAQDRLAATEAELESISTRLYDTLREHTSVVRQKDDMITRNSEKMNALEAELAQHCDKTAGLATQIENLNTEISARDEKISALMSSLSTATSKTSDLEAQETSIVSVTAEVSVQTEDVEEDNDDAHTEVEFEGETFLLTASNPLGRSQSMILSSPTSSPGSLLRRHSLTGIQERAKQSLEDVTATSEEESDATLETATEPDDVAADEAAVEEALVVAIPESTEPSTSAVETGGPALPEGGLSASMWAPSVRLEKHELPARPQVDWAAEAASRKGQNASKNHHHTPQARNEEQQRSRWGKDRQGFAAFNTAQRVASGKAGGVKVTKNSKKDVRYISKETDYKFHDYR